jgi:6-phosphogluconolactonase
LIHVKRNRRTVLHALAAAPAAWLYSRAGLAAESGSFAFVGTYTPNGGGIYLFHMDALSGGLTQLRVTDGIRNPSWLALDPSRTHLYAVSEVDNLESGHSGGLSAYAIDATSRQLTLLGGISSQGGSPAHASVHPSGKFVFVANYGGGTVAVFPIGADGALGEATDVRPMVGARHRPHAVDDPPGQYAPSNHDGPHPHMIASDPTGQFVIANDAGLDLTLVWKFDAAAGKLLPAEVPVITAPSGSAPRHFVFHPNGRTFYNLYEHDAKIAVFDYDSRGGFRLRQSLSTLPPKFAGSNLASSVILSADGKFLYSANRIHSAVSVFAVGEDGELRFLSEHWTHADSPRSIAIDPSGQFLFSCNQRSDSLTSFRINAASGALTFTGRFEPVGSPAAMVFIKS